MLDELERIFETLDFENGGSLVFTGFDRDSQRAVLRFDLHTGTSGREPEPWTVTCEGVEAFGLSGGTASGLEVSDDDPALWPHTQPSGSLFCGPVAPERADSLLGVLYRAHLEAVGEAEDAVPFGRGINAVAAFDGGAGLVARGPLPLLRAYQAALDTHGVETSVVGSFRPERRNAHARVPVPDEMQVLLIGDCWVVAESFDVARAATPGE